MDALDGLIILVAGLAAVRGVRTGAAAQLVAFIALVVGLAVGIVLVVVVVPDVHGELPKTFTALGCILVPSLVVGVLGRRFGRRAFEAMRRLRLRRVDQLLGAAISAATTLVMFWLFASIAVNSELGVLPDQIERSALIQAVEKVMPPVPDAFTSVEHFLSADGYPQVLVNVLPESVAPVTIADHRQMRELTASAGPSTLKIVALGCGDEQEGSGFVVQVGSGHALVVTNAHVVAGTDEISVVAPSGVVAAATPVLFDPRFDLAVLRVDAPIGPALTLDANVLERGSPTVVLGYPGGGPFTTKAAGVIARFAAEGRDIYGDALTVRTVYELRAVVRPGDSGGPLLGTGGSVVGVVFSRSATNPDVGYALASPAVLTRVETAERHPVPATTGGCIG